MKHKKLLINIKKAEGMLFKITQMIEEDAYCVDIATQVNATIGLLKEANRHILKKHLMHCGNKNLTSNNEEKVEAFVDELIRVRDVSTRK